MKLLPSKIATMAGCTEEEVTEQLDGALNAIRAYTNKTFVTPKKVSGNITITNGLIHIEGHSFNPGEVIELLLSNYNTGIYLIKEVTENTLTVYNSDTLLDEEFMGYIAMLNFNIPLSSLASMINYKVTVTAKIGVKSESLEGYSYTLNTDSAEVRSGYPLSVLSGLNHLKQMPGQESREYANAGIPIKQPLCR